MNEVFINFALANALSNYINLKDDNIEKKQNDFLTYIVGILCYIYGEENIIGLYEKNDPRSFTYLLKKYNISDYEIEKFYTDIKKYNEIDNRCKLNGVLEKNPYFTYIQEEIINMFFAKYQAVKFEKSKLIDFKNFLFTPINPVRNMVIFNERIAPNKNYILDYYNAKMFEIENELDFTLLRDNYLSDEVYAAFGLTKDKLEKLSTKDIESINKKIFSLYRINPIDPNINEKIMEEMKKNNPKKVIVKLATQQKMTKLLLFVIIGIVLTVIISLIIIFVVKG